MAENIEKLRRRAFRAAEKLAGPEAWVVVSPSGASALLPSMDDAAVFVSSVRPSGEPTEEQMLEELTAACNAILEVRERRERFGL